MFAIGTLIVHTEKDVYLDTKGGTLAIASPPKNLKSGATATAGFYSLDNSWYLISVYVD